MVDGPNTGKNGMKKGLSENTENPARGASRVRTGDPLLAKQMRYQLRHSPVVHCSKSVHQCHKRLFGTCVGPGGLEPPTSSLSGMRSNQLSYGPNQHVLRRTSRYFTSWVVKVNPETLRVVNIL